MDRANMEAKDARREFADGAALRIACIMHQHLRRGTPVLPDMWRRWWKEEAKAAKNAGLYSPSTYIGDAGNGLMGMSEERGWIRNVPPKQGAPCNLTSQH